MAISTQAPESTLDAVVPKATPRSVQTVKVLTKGAGGLLRLSVTGPIRVLQPEKTVAAGEQETRFSIYLPAAWGETDHLTFSYLSEGKELVHKVALTAETRYGFRSRVLGASTLHLPPTQTADFWVEVLNTGNREQNFLLELENPQPVRSAIEPSQLSLAPGATGRSRISMQGAEGMQAQTVRIRTREDDHQERHYLFLESYPTSLPTESLYSHLDLRTQLTLGSWNEKPGWLWQFGLAGELQKDVTLDLFIQKGNFPAQTVMPGGDTENRWKFFLDAPSWYFHAGEIRVPMERVWGQSLLGEGVDFAAGGFEIFGGRENLGFHDKDFGGARYRLDLGPHRLTGTILGKLNDVPERGGDWQGASFRWDYRNQAWNGFAELAMTEGGLGRGSSVFGSVEYLDRPWRVRVEGGWGDLQFAGALQGQTIIQSHVSWNDFYLRGYWSDYQQPPIYEPTRAEILLDPTPDFLRRSGSRQLALGQQGTPWSWSLEHRETFQRSDFSQQSIEDFAQVGWRHTTARSQLGLAVKAGRESQLRDSSFAELSADWSYGHEKTQLNAGLRLTRNFQDDPDAINRNGVQFYGGLSYAGPRWQARLDGQAYAHDDSQSGRVNASLGYKFNPQEQLTLSASALWHSDANHETGAFLSFSKTSEVENRTHPLRGRVAGVIFEDKNANGLQDPDEAGLPNVVTRYAGVSLLTDAQGKFAYPALPAGERGFKVIPEFEGQPIIPTREVPSKVRTHRGETTWLVMGWVRPVEFSGTVLLKSFDGLSGGRSQTAPDPARKIMFTGAGTFEVNTRGNGTFSILLPAGSYRARIEGEDLARPWSQNIATEDGNISILLEERKQRIIKTFRQ